ncbi:hypothetical protein BDW74DRAFT_182748 [Aspergillus multicolor]|uniref:uncharacterized protein n=1 Tax=Aspergillus multicolor TaxID=41759 RepID=UPI003CCE43B8
MVTFDAIQSPRERPQGPGGAPVLHQRVPEEENPDQSALYTGNGGNVNENETAPPLPSPPSTPKCPPIAIVGMALRLPGGVASPSELWDFLINKRNGVCEVPETRYNIDSFYSESMSRCVKTRRGYYLQSDPACFDAEFFNITAHEAGRMDPQQRQLHEVVWECLESAGETDWREKRIGCYVGVYGEDWLDLASKDPLHTDRYHILGTGQFALANRLSYEFDFQGPSMTLQTGCSASLVGLHEACQALYSGDCCSAVVAGTNLMFAPTMTATMSDNTVMSPTGTCRTFDEAADGYGRGEGVNALYVKRLEDAIRDNDPIRAVIRATSTNCDGHTPSITTPGSHSQEALVRWAYEKAGIPDITQTGFFECHGTGTVAGDTAEASVVAKLFEGKGVIMGAVKPNVGHGEGASGISSVIKGVLALEHNTIPPNVFFKTPNPKIPFEEGELHVPVEVMPWPENRHQRVSVNCFGVGGANAHAILDSVSSFCGDSVRPVSTPCETGRLIVVSARSTEALRQRIQAVADYANSDLSKLHDLAYTLGTRREHLSHRAFIVVPPNEPLDEGSFQTGRDKAPEVTFVFTGQGAQWAGMGKNLLDTFPSARADIRSLDKALRSLPSGPSWSIEDELLRSAKSRVNEAELSQPLCTALQIALINVLSAWGIAPSSVVGHSSGEIAAAYAAGAITATAAIIIAYYRGKLAKQVEGKGAMAAVGLSREQVMPYLENGIVIACENSPQSVTLSGDSVVVDKAVDAITRDHPDILCRRLRVATAYHSSHMSEIGAQYEARIREHIEQPEKRKDAMLPLYSSVTANAITEPSELDATYWRRNLESPVLFSPAIREVLKTSKNRAFIEIGPHSALSGPLQQIFRAAQTKAELLYIPTLTRNDPDSRTQLLVTAGLAHSSGIPASFDQINGPGNTVANLPPYPWQHNTRYWHDSRLTREWRFRSHLHHELLGSRSVESSELEPAWRNLLRLEDVPWIAEHALQGNVIFPGAGYISMAGEAALQLNTDATDYSIRNMLIKNPLLMKESAEYELITTLKPVKITDLVESEWFAFTIVSYDGTAWTKHCHGQIRAGCDRPPKGRKIKRHARVLDVEACYRYVERLGFAYGPLFRRFTSLSADPNDRRASATLIDLPRPKPSDGCRYPIHPAVMDHLLQAFPMAVAQGLSRRFQIIVPAAIGHIYVRRPDVPEAELSLEALMAETGFGTLTGQAIMMARDAGGNENDAVPVLSMSDVMGFPASGDGDTASNPLGSQIRWAPDIDFLNTQMLLPRNDPDEEYARVMQTSRELSVLFILETAAKLESVTAEPVLPRIETWKAWVYSTAARLSQHTGTAGEVLEMQAQKWTGMDSEARQGIIRTLLSQYQSNTSSEADTETMPAPLSCLQYIYENCEDLMTAETLPDEARAHIDKYCTFLYAPHDHGWGHFLSHLGHSNPAMRIIEIGSGPGSVTRFIMKHLKSPEAVRLYSMYTSTDAFDENIEAAKKAFAEEDVEFKHLDLTRDVAEQGFEKGSFDLVIASNIHRDSGKELGVSLKNIRELLAPRGRLLLQELSEEHLSADFVMGLLPGWRIADGPVEMPIFTSFNVPDRLAGIDKGLDCGLAQGPNQKFHHELNPELDSALHAAGISEIKAVSKHDATLSLISSIHPEMPENKTIVLLTEATAISPWNKMLKTALEEQGHEVLLSNLQSGLPTPSKAGDEVSDNDRDKYLVISLLDLDGPYLHNLCEDGFKALQTLLSDFNQPILWVTKMSQFRCEDPRYGLIFGFARTMRHEKEADFSTFETDVFDDAAAKSVVSVVRKLQWSRAIEYIDPEYEFALDQGIIQVGRCHWVSPADHMNVDASKDLSRRLDIESLGSIDTLRWISFEDPALQEGEVEIDMQYIGLNFRDILVSLGLFGEPNEFGLEGSGIIRRVAPGTVRDLKVGDRVALLTTGTFRTRFVVHSRYCLRIPDHVSLQDAATMPSVYITAAYCLGHLARLQKGESVLIHSACGGVGLAAIRVSEYIGAKIYATVGSEEKVQYLIDRFGISRERIFNSRSTDFLHDVLRETNGRGVDVVLNSLTGALLHASWDCLASFGRMIELGKRDFLSGGQLNMGPFIRNRSYMGFDLTQFGREAVPTYETMHEQFETLSEKNELVPIRPVKVYEAAEVVDAFRYMQQGVHMGKILIKMPDDPNSLSVSPGQSPFSFRSDASYLLVGGLGGLGRSVSTWMVERGARCLVYLSRSVCASEKDQTFIHELEEQGCEVLCVPGDVTVAADVENAIEKCPRPLAGIAQMAGVLQDALFERMTYSNWKTCTAPKVQGTWNLHDATFSPTKNTNLDFFITVSSVSGICGNPGQSNYAAANTFLDSFTQYRRNLGLPAAVLDLGAIEEVGMMAANSEAMQRAQAAAVTFPSEQQLIDGLKLALSECAAPPPQDKLMSTSCIIGLSNTKSLSNPSVRPYWVRDARFALYANLELKSTEPTGQGSSNELRLLLRRIEQNPSLLDDPESEDIVRREIGAQVTQRMPQAENMDEDEIANIAIDSLMAIEIRGWARRNLGLEITLVQIAKAKTVGGLTRAAVDHLKVKYGMKEKEGTEGEGEGST